MPRRAPIVVPMTLLTDTTVPTTTPDERAARLTEAGAAWGSRITADASAAQLAYRVRGVGQGAVASTISAGKHEFVVDEPAALAGDDVAASPDGTFFEIPGRNHFNAPTSRQFREAALGFLGVD